MENKKDVKVFFLGTGFRLKRVMQTVTVDLAKEYGIKNLPTIAIRRLDQNNAFVVGIVDNDGKLEARKIKEVLKDEQKQAKNN